MKETIYRMKSLSDRLPPSLGVQFHICGTTYPNRLYSVTRPNSPVFCIEHISSGTGEVHLGDTVFYPRAGDTYLLPQSADHFYHSDRHDPWEKIWVNVSGEFFVRLARDCGIDKTYHYPSLDTSDLLLKIQYYAARPDDPTSAEKCLALVVQLFLRLANALSEHRSPDETPVQKMLHYIDRHETDPISLDRLAGVSGRSPSQAERLFRREVGIPPYRYALNRKMELACQLLQQTGMSVRDIASYLSFEDEFYFSGLFRRKIGVSPVEYRKNCEKATANLQKETQNE